MVDETKLLLRLRKKQENSINQAIEIYTPYLSTVLYNMLGNSLPREDIEEIISDIFIMLWKNADYIDLSKGTMRSYMAVSAKNLALKKLAKKKELISLDEICLPDEKNFTEENADKDFLWKAVMSLGEPDSEIFVRYYKYGEKLTHIAKVTSLNLSTVKSKLSRGKLKLKKILSTAEEML